MYNHFNRKKKYYEEKGGTAYTIWKEHKSNGWVLSSVQRLVKRFKMTGIMDRKSGSGQPTATTEENADLVESLICSQEEPGTHKSPREIALIGISKSSVKRLGTRKKPNQFKRMKALRMTEGTRERRTTRSRTLADGFEKNLRLIEKCVFQDEKDFTLKVPTNAQNNRVYCKGNKRDVPVKNLFHQTNRQSKESYGICMFDLEWSYQNVFCK